MACAVFEYACMSGDITPFYVLATSLLYNLMQQKRFEKGYGV